MPYPLFTKIPPCPGDPALYVLVKRGKVYYWRGKRGSKKPATLNATLLHRSEVMKKISPFIKELKELLKPYLKHMQLDDLHQQLYKHCEGPFAKKGVLDFSGLKNFDFQPKHPIGNLLDTGYRVDIKGDVLKLVIDASPEAVKKHNAIVTEFVFELLTVSGEAGGLRLAVESSPVFDISRGLETNYVHEVRLPAQQPWMLILKVSCFEGGQWARSGRHYGMKVVGVG